MDKDTVQFLWYADISWFLGMSSQIKISKKKEKKSSKMETKYDNVVTDFICLPKFFLAQLK